MLELMPHQLQAVKEMSNGKVLVGDVGSGKSLTAIMYYYTKVCNGIPSIKGFSYKRMETPRDIYVFTTAKKRNELEWEKEFAQFGISRESNENGIQAHVDSWNNITNYEHLTDAFVILDEQRLVGNGAWVKTFIKLAKNNQWIVLSATPGDTWMDYVALFVANGFYKNRTEFVREHVVYSRFSKYPKIDRYVATGALESYRRKILVKMPYARHTIRKILTVPVDYDTEKFQKVLKERWNIFEERPIKDVAELFAVMRKLVNSDVSRLGEVMRIMEKHPRLIIFYNFNYELEMLRTLGPILNVMIHEWNGHKHQSVPEGDTWIYLVQYTAGAEGWNCITTNAMVFYSLNYSWKINEQSKGRIDRLNTPYEELYYYILRSMSPIDKAIHRALLNKEDFNERAHIAALSKD